MKKALVFGANGQAGSYLCEFLLSKGYRVVGAIRAQSPGENLTECMKNPNFGVNCHIDVRTDYGVRAALRTAANYWDEVYNMTGKMFAPASWDNPSEYITVNGLAVGNMLDQLRRHPSTKFFNAGSAEVFERPMFLQSLHILSKRAPMNPYGWGKYLAEGLVDAYRTKFGLFACTGIFFNMESPRRPRTFFAQKVAYEAVRVAREYYSGTISNPVIPVPMKLGKLHAERDWGLASEYVEAAWRMLQAGHPKDYVIGSGVAFSCRHFVREALFCAGICPDQTFSGFVEYDEAVGDFDRLASNPDDICRDLGWKAKSKMQEVVAALVAAEKERQEKEVGKSIAAG